MCCNIARALNKTNPFHGHATDGLYTLWVNTPLSQVCVFTCACLFGVASALLKGAPYGDKRCHRRIIFAFRSWALQMLRCSWAPRAHARLKGVCEEEGSHVRPYKVMVEEGMYAGRGLFDEQTRYPIRRWRRVWEEALQALLICCCYEANGFNWQARGRDIWKAGVWILRSVKKGSR